MAVMLLTLACSSEDNEIVENPQLAQTRVVPIEVTVNSANGTRAYLSGSCYNFQANDKLYVWDASEKIYGVLDMKTYGGTNSTFEGTLTVESGASLVSGTTTLNAVIKSENDEILGSITDFKNNSFKPNHKFTIADDNSSAVEKYSFLTSSGTYYSTGTDFGFISQESSFLSFEVTLEDGTQAGHKMTATIINDGEVARTGTVTAYKDAGDGNKIKVKFVAGFPTTPTTTLSSANITLGGRTPINFGGTTTLAANMIYNVKKTYADTKRYTITASAMGKNHSSTDKPMGYQMTLQDILNGMDLSTYSSMISSCTRTSGESVVVEDLGTNPKDYRFTVVNTGESVFSMKAMGVSIPVTINVTQQ